MNEATQKMVEALASKLGTTAEHLWGVLVRQAPIESACSILVLVALFVALAIGAVLIAYKAPRDGYAAIERIEVLWLVWFLLLGIVMFAAIVSTPSIVGGFVNPEYWALKEVMR